MRIIAFVNIDIRSNRNCLVCERKWFYCKSIMCLIFIDNVICAKKNLKRNERKRKTIGSNRKFNLLTYCNFCHAAANKIEKQTFTITLILPNCISQTFTVKNS